MSWSEEGVAAIARILEEGAGLTFSPLRRPYAEAAIRRAMTRARTGTLDEYARRLRAEPELLAPLVSEAVVGETYFFRDPAQFGTIRNVIVREIVERMPGARVRAWSAGCASGEEAYSLSMLFAGMGLKERVSILATDVSAAAIERARRGIYGAWSFRSVDSAPQSPFFTRVSGGWSVTAHARAPVEFLVQNLVRSEQWPVGYFDLILCRNVLMYFDAAGIEQVVTRFVASLRPGGWLVTSAGDPLLPPIAGLTLVTTPAGILYRKAAPAPLPIFPPLDVERAVECPALQPAALPMLEPRDETPIAAAPLPEAPNPDLFLQQALEHLELGAPAEAALCARRALYLDRSLAVAHFVLARALRMLGWDESARRSLRHVGALVAELPPEEPVGAGGGISPHDMAAGVGAELALLERGARSHR